MPSLLSSLTLPSPRAPRSQSSTLRWGVIGTGIAEKFVSSMLRNTSQQVVAVSARDQARTAAFAAAHEIDTVHTSVGDLVADPSVDVVYIATPHPLHHEQALAAISAGKHVLIEKPIAMNAAEATEILTAARAAGVLVTEAMWTRYLPQSDVIRQVIGEGMIGDVRLVRADFGFPFPFDSAHRLWNADLGGGALLDAGVYPISFAQELLGDPTRVEVLGEAAHGVDARADLLLEAASGATAMLSTSLVSALPCTASIVGSVGRIDLEGPFFGPTAITVTVESSDSARAGRFEDPRRDSFHDGLSDQAVAFADAVGSGRVETTAHPHSEIISVMRTIDLARASILGKSA